jgi:hypothetical protein
MTTPALELLPSAGRRFPPQAILSVTPFSPNSNISDGRRIGRKGINIDLTIWSIIWELRAMYFICKAQRKPLLAILSWGLYFRDGGKGKLATSGKLDV